MDDVIAPLMGGMPDIERIMNDVQSVDSEDIDAPLDAPKEVSKDYKAAIESSLAAEALDLDSADKRQACSLSCPASMLPFVFGFVRLSSVQTGSPVQPVQHVDILSARCWGAFSGAEACQEHRRQARCLP